VEISEAAAAIKRCRANGFTLTEIVAGLAIKAFAGLRTGELVRLTWDRVGSKKIEIRAKKSKSPPSLPAKAPELRIDGVRVAAVDKKRAALYIGCRKASGRFLL